MFEGWHVLIAVVSCVQMFGMGELEGSVVVAAKADPKDSFEAHPAAENSNLNLNC